MGLEQLGVELEMGQLFLGVAIDHGFTRDSGVERAHHWNEDAGNHEEAEAEHVRNLHSLNLCPTLINEVFVNQPSNKKDRADDGDVHQID